MLIRRIKQGKVYKNYSDIGGLRCIYHVLCKVHLCVTVRSVSLWKFGFYCECYVCNACAEHSLNHFIVYLIIYAILCCVSVHDGEVLCCEVHELQQR